MMFFETRQRHARDVLRRAAASTEALADAVRVPSPDESPESRAFSLGAAGALRRAARILRAEAEACTRK